MSPRLSRRSAVLAAALAGAGIVIADRVHKVRRVPRELRVPFAVVPLPITAGSLRLVRAIIGRLLYSHVPGVRVTERMIPGPGGMPPVRIVVAERPDRPNGSPALLWIHGGGFVIGSGGAVPATGPRLSHELNVLVVGVDYRLAPEHPAPAALDDCAAALLWLHDHALELGIDPGRIGIGGESAGGGLAASLAQRARDEVTVPVAFQALVYPMLDDRTVLCEPPPGVGELVWTPEANRFGWAAYLGAEPGADRCRSTRSPHAGLPLRACPPLGSAWAIATSSTPRTLRTPSGCARRAWR